MGGTAQAGIVSANHGLHSIQHAMRDFLAFDVMLRDLEHAAVHRQIVLPGRNNKVAPADQALLVNFVVMKQCAARRFRVAYAFKCIWTREGANMLVEDLNEPGLMVVKGTENSRALELVELRQFLVGARSSTAVRNVQARKRSHAVNAIWKSLRLVVGRLQIAPGLNLLSQEFEIARRVEIVGHDVSARVDDTKFSVIKREAAIFLNSAHKQRREVSKRSNLVAELLHRAFQPLERTHGDLQGIGNCLQDGIAVFLREGVADAAGYDPCRMNSFPAEALDDLLAEFA